MAGKVNVKFVVILSVVMVALFAVVAATALSVLRKSAPELARLGDAKMAEGNYKLASELYSKAVNKDQRNVEFLNKWLGALRKWVPENQTQLESAYSRQLVPLLRSIAITKQNDIPAYIAHLDALYEPLARSSFSSGGFDNLIAETETALKYFGETPADEPVDILRKYRAIAISRQISEGLEVPAEKVDLAREDFDAALKASPADDQAHDARVNFYSVRGEIARRKGQDLIADELYTEAAKATQLFVESCPDSPLAWVTQLGTRIQETRREEIGKPGTQDTIARVRARLNELRPDFEALARRLESVEPSRISGITIDKFKLIDAFINNLKPTFDETEKLLKRVVAADPTNFDHIGRLADLHVARQRYPEAISELAKIESLPALPVSYDALRLNDLKINVVGTQSLLALRMADESSDPAVRKSALEQGKQLRERLGKLVPQDAPVLKKLDARVAMLEKDIPSAMKLLTLYNQLTNNSDVEACWLLARCAKASNQIGLARQQLTRLLELDPGNVAGNSELAEIEMQLRNYPKAEQLYMTLVEAQPDNARFKERLAVVQSLQRGGTAAVENRVTAALLAAQQAAEAPGDRAENLEKSIQILRDAMLESPDDLTLLFGLVTQLNAKGDKDAAIQLVDAAIEKNPENQGLKALKIQLSEADPIQARIKVLQQSSLPDFDKQAELFTAYRDAGMQPEAQKALAEMIRLSPEDPRTYEGRFISAVEAKDLETARRIAQEAVAKDIDKVSGLTFTARLDIADGKEREAILKLEEASRSGNINPQTWVLLARLQLKTGRSTDAVRSYASALALRPDDVSIIKERIGALVTAGQGADALAAAREGERFAVNDRQFQDMLLVLMSEFGDENAKKSSLEKRRLLASQDPQNRDNLMALASQLMTAGEYSEAKSIIDQAAGDKPDLDVVELQARWHADQNDMPEALKAWNAYLGTLNESTATAEPYLRFGQFLNARNQPELAIRVFDTGRRFQDPKTMSMDKAMADTLARIGRFDESAVAYKRVVDANADTENQDYRKRLIESLIRLRKLDEAQVQLTAYGDKLEADPVLMLLQSDVFRGQEKSREAREILDRTIVKFPEESLAYIRRAELLQSVPGSESDVLADLDAAMRVNPRSWQALSLRASILLRQDRVDEAVRDVRRALELAPGADEMRIGFTRELLRRGKETEAVELNNSAVRTRSSDVQLLLSVGALFAESGFFNRAHEYNKRAFALSKTPAVASAYLQTLLADPAGPVSEAENVLKEVGNAEISKDANLLIFRARLLAKRNKLADARNDLGAAIKLMPKNNPGAILYWDSQGRTVFQGKPDEYLRFLESIQGQGEIGDWFAFLRANQKIVTGQPEQLTAAVNELEQIIGSTSSQPVLQAASRMRVSTLYQLEKYEDAVKAADQALERFPDDWEVNNNVAFTLAVKLNRPADALPYAEKAASAAPSNPDVWDTLGATRLRLGQLPEAQDALVRGLTAAGPSSSRIPVLIHLAQLHVARKDKASAEIAASQAKDAMDKYPQVGERYKAELDEVNARIQAM